MSYINLTDKLRCFFSIHGSWLFLLLCVVTFLIGITTGTNVFKNAWLIFWYEAIFCLGYFIHFILRRKSFRLFPSKSIGFWLIVAWFVSVTASLIFSPYGLMTEWFAVSRYFQTVFHIIFFICVLGLFNSYEGSKTPLLFSLAGSVFILALIFIGSWFQLESTESLHKHFWYLKPPRNAHIRITDFLVTASTALLLPYGMKVKTHGFDKLRASALYLLPVMWGFLFWCGGRAGIISAFLTGVFYIAILLFKRIRAYRVMVIFLLSLVCGYYIADLFAVFPWNGLGGAAERTVRYGTSVEAIATGRLDYWATVWESLKETGSYVFGLGSQGYCYMPNRIYAFQPHNFVFQFLAEWGFSGTIIFIALMGYGFILGLKRYVVEATKSLSGSALAACCIIISLGLHGFLDGTLYHAQSSFYFAIAFAVWVSQKRSDVSASRV